MNRREHSAQGTGDGTKKLLFDSYAYGNPHVFVIPVSPQIGKRRKEHALSASDSEKSLCPTYIRWKQNELFKIRGGRETENYES
jgi:hypothetical protein